MLNYQSSTYSKSLPHKVLAGGTWHLAAAALGDCFPTWPLSGMADAGHVSRGKGWEGHSHKRVDLE
jgi:hypothetical protein